MPGTQPKPALARMRRVVINGRFLGRPVTGVERYALETLRAIDELSGAKDPLTSGLAIAVAVPSLRDVGVTFRNFEIRETGRLKGHAWEQLDLPLFAGTDLLVNLCNTGPVFKRNSLVCVHDAHVWLAPESFSLPFRSFYKLAVPLLLRNSRRWMTVSRYSESQLLHFGAARSPAAAVTANGHNHVRRWKPENSRLPASIPDRFIFALASRSPLKNTALIYQVADRLKETGIGLVIAGSSNKRVFGEVRGREEPLASIVELGRVSDDDVAMLMSRAICFVFPSYHEGFGVPPIEAMALGCPVVASDRSALPEVLGDAAMLCSPDDVDAWVGAVTALALDPELRSNYVKRGLARSRLYDWTETGMAVLRQIVAA